MTFKDLGLRPELLRAVEDLGYTQPSPIQEKAIPPVLQKRDLIACAQTGTGKTAAFAVPILQNLSALPNKNHKPIRVLVLTPTRELALQIKESFDAYGKYLRLKNTVVFGGVGQTPQVDAVRAGVDILVATPGRLNDLCNQGHIDLSSVEYFVLDEADRMLDMGFIHDVRKVLARLPDTAHRQTLLFSATMPAEIEALARQILREPVRVAVTPVSSTVDAIEQSVYKLDKGNKPALLVEILKSHPEYDSVLVFTRTKHGADRVVKELAHKDIEALAIHGNKSQTARQTALNRFKTGDIRVLVATDIAARGIDISGLACVLNYELPNIPETYVHRIGRTGRAGREGVAISFCNFDELPYLKDIEKLIGKRVPVIDEHPYPMMIFELTPKPVRQPRPPREERERTRSAQPRRSEREPAARDAAPRGVRGTRSADGTKGRPAEKSKTGPVARTGNRPAPHARSAENGRPTESGRGGSARPRRSSRPARGNRRQG